MKYSFPKGKRFRDPILICQTSCYDQIPINSKRASGFGFGNKSDFTKNNSTNTPFEYDIRSSFEINVSQKRGSSFGMSRNKVKHRNYLTTSFNAGPGPGEYESPQRYSRSYSLRPRTADPWAPKFLNDSQFDRINIPGPGHYNIVLRQQKRWFNMVGIQKRFKTDSSLVPGPGDYEQDPSSLSKYKSTQRSSFGSEERKSFVDVAVRQARRKHVPGPGNYKIYSNF